jgi:hypothetical protein
MPSEKGSTIFAQAANMIDWRTRPVAEAEPIGLWA